MSCQAPDYLPSRGGVAFTGWWDTLQPLGTPFQQGVRGTQANSKPANPTYRNLHAPNCLFRSYTFPTSHSLAFTYFRTISLVFYVLSSQIHLLSSFHNLVWQEQSPSPFDR